jgi:replication factor C small subunit
MKELWTEKYRPRCIEEVIGQDGTTERLKAYVSSGEMPHLLFAGPAGTGKTTCSICLAREFFGESWQENFFELNASDERGIDVVRGKIKDFARTSPIGGHRFKIIFLDEADALTNDAQAALRRTMERFPSCRFILSCNYSNRIIEPIQSRCAVFRFLPLSKEDIKKYLNRICKCESLEITEETADALSYISRGDLRKATNILQAAASQQKKVTPEILYNVASIPEPDLMREITEDALNGKFGDAREKLYHSLIDLGLSGETVLELIHEIVLGLGLPPRKLAKALGGIGETAYRIVEGSNPVIQLDALLAKLGEIGEDTE